MMTLDKEIIKQRLSMLIDSRMQNMATIEELEENAKILKKRLQIDTD